MYLQEGNKCNDKITALPIGIQSNIQLSMEAKLRPEPSRRLCPTFMRSVPRLPVTAWTASGLESTYLTF